MAKLRTSRDVGAMIKGIRRAVGMSQEQLGQLIGASQRWVSQLENGKETVELGKVLRAIHALKIRLDAQTEREQERKTGPRAPSFDDGVDIGEIVDELADPLPNMGPKQ
jgi:transcriptional regulator with XRE-family HTH domain